MFPSKLGRHTTSGCGAISNNSKGVKYKRWPLNTKSSHYNRDEITPCILYYSLTLQILGHFPCSNSYLNTTTTRRNVTRLGSATNRHVKVSWMAQLKVRMVHITRTGMIIARNSCSLRTPGWRWERVWQTMSTKVSWQRILMGPWEHSRRWSPNWSMEVRHKHNGESGNKGMPNHKRRATTNSGPEIAKASEIWGVTHC